VADEHDRLREDLPAYALDALEPAERARVEAHLGGCDECNQALTEYRAVFGLLPRALRREAPPARVREMLLVRARGEPPPAPVEPVEARPVVAARPARRPAGFGLRQALRALGWAAVAAVLAVAIPLWSVQQGAGPHPSVAMEVLARLPGGRIIPLGGTGAPGAGARLYVAPDGQRAELAVVGLPPLSPDRTYQLWFARPGQPTITGGAFRVGDLGQTTAPATIPAPLGQVSQIAVTEEPSPGSLRPTGEHLLDWFP
jgi:hypothetical protein